MYNINQANYKKKLRKCIIKVAQMYNNNFLFNINEKP